jgi:hypothetical protein
MEESSTLTAKDVDVGFALENRQAVTDGAVSMAIGDDEERPCDRKLGSSLGPEAHIRYVDFCLVGTAFLLNS